MKTTFDRTDQIVVNQPNWASRVREVFRFKTDIITPRDGPEMRYAMRRTPRIGISFRSDQLDERADQLFADLNDWQDGGVFLLPCRWRNGVLASDHPQGTNILALSPSRPWWINDGTELVIEGGGVQEAVTVATATDSVLTLAAPLAHDFTAGNRVMLAYRVRYPEQNDLRSRTNTHYRFDAEFEVVPGSYPRFSLPDYTPAAVHEGYEVFLLRPNWRDPVKTRISDQREVVDTEKGVPDVNRIRPGSSLDITSTFLRMTRGQVDSLLQFFLANKGSQGSFWLPTWRHDLNVQAGALAGEKRLTFVGHNLLQMYSANESLTTVMVEFEDGCVQLNRITAIAQAGDGTEATFWDDWGRDVSTAVRVSFVLFARFLSDTLELEWHTSEVAEAQITFRATENTWINQQTSSGPMELPMPNENTTFSQYDTEPELFLAINLEAAGVPLAAVDRGHCLVSVSMTGATESGIITESTQLDLDMAFYDEDMNRLLIDFSADYQGHAYEEGDGHQAEIQALARIPGIEEHEDGDVKFFGAPVRNILVKAQMI